MTVRDTILTTAALTLAATIGIRATAASPSQSTPARQTPGAGRSGAEVFRTACITCHSADGTGNPKSHVGFDVPLPDFTDCAATTPELERDWFSIIYNGGPIRAFDRHMPAFGEALSEQEIWNVIGYLRTFCTDRRWPLGELNLPRPLLTEKAFPENEALVTTSVNQDGGTAVSTQFVYERRLGARTQFELAVPVEMQHADGEDWTRGLGDTAVALKHALLHRRRSILSAGVELLLPTGKENLDLGKGVTIFEPFAAFGQMLPGNAFVQAHTGVELPTNQSKAAREAFWRVAAGRTFNPHRFGRQLSPMIEIAGAKELVAGEPPLWDIVPQMQLSLSKRQHVRLSGGLQVPINDRDGRGKTFHMYLLWDWFDGPLFSGW